MTPYDAAMVGVIVAGMIWGALRGITWQLASIASLVLGYAASHALSGQLAPYFWGEPLVARSLAMLVIYVVISGGVFLGAWFIRATLRRMQFEAYDRHLGMMLGGAEGALLGLVVTLFVVSLAPGARDPIFTSRTGRVVSNVMATLSPILPEEARNALAPFWGGPSASGSEASEGPSSVLASEPAKESPSRPAQAGSPRDPDTSPVSFRDLIEKSERQIGKAIVDGATDSLKRAAKGGDGDGRSGTIERR
jgi:membrane protein required for colicin V production